MERVSIKKISSPGLINAMFYIVMSVLFLVILTRLSGHTVYAQNSTVNTLSSGYIIDGDEWHYFKGLQKPPSAWNRYDFDVSSWQRGSTGIGYGTSNYRTYIGDMKENYLTIYARKEFYIDAPSSAAGMTLSVVCDGPFIAYLNGVEMIRTKTVQISTPEQPVGVEDAEQYNVSGFVHELIPGTNVLALQCDNDDINSDDFTFIPVFEVFEKKGGQ